jgi:hypothetical protein
MVGALLALMLAAGCSAGQATGASNESVQSANAWSSADIAGGSSTTPPSTTAVPKSTVPAPRAASATSTSTSRSTPSRTTAASSRPTAPTPLHAELSVALPQKTKQDPPIAAAIRTYQGYLGLWRLARSSPGIDVSDQVSDWLGSNWSTIFLEKVNEDTKDDVAFSGTLAVAITKAESKPKIVLLTTCFDETAISASRKSEPIKVSHPNELRFQTLITLARTGSGVTGWQMIGDQKLGGGC